MATLSSELGYETDSSVSDGHNEYVMLSAERITLHAKLRLAEEELRCAPELEQAQRLEEEQLDTTNYAIASQVSSLDAAIRENQLQISALENQSIADTVSLIDWRTRLETAERQLAAERDLKTTAEQDEKNAQERYQELLLQKTTLNTRVQQKIQDVNTLSASNRQKEETFKSVLTSFQQQRQQLVSLSIPADSAINVLKKRCKFLEWYANHERRLEEEAERAAWGYDRNPGRNEGRH